jgi:hypothetical protein
MPRRAVPVGLPPSDAAPAERHFFGRMLLPLPRGGRPRLFAVQQGRQGFVTVGWFGGVAREVDVRRKTPSNAFGGVGRSCLDARPVRLTRIPRDCHGRRRTTPGSGSLRRAPDQADSLAVAAPCALASGRAASTSDDVGNGRHRPARRTAALVLTVAGGRRTPSAPRELHAFRRARRVKEV